MSADVVAVAAVDEVVALAADEHVDAEAAVEGQLACSPPASAEASIVSSPPWPLTVSVSLAVRIRAGDAHFGRQAGDA